MIEVALEGVRIEREGRVVLDVPSLTIGGRTTAVLGPNGSGKTTLLRVIAGLERPMAGRVRLGTARAARPDHVAYVFQENVFLRQSVRENLALGLRLRGAARAEAHRRVDEALDVLGVAHLADRRADRLSGGEARRVSLARALCLRAPLVLLDEPLAGLDEGGYRQFLDDLPRILTAFDATTVLVTHNVDEALRLADRLVVIVDGTVRADGAIRDVVSAPRSAAVAAVLGYTLLRADGRTVAVAAGDLTPGSGLLQFTMVVEGVIDLIGTREIVGRIDATRVRVAWPDGASIPAVGQRVVVSAVRFTEVSCP